jgi:hypothetical protein
MFGFSNMNYPRSLGLSHDPFLDIILGSYLPQQILEYWSILSETMAKPNYFGKGIKDVKSRGVFPNVYPVEVAWPYPSG